jgi:hypothetical protein
MYKTVGDSVATVVALNLGRDAKRISATKAPVNYLVCLIKMLASRTGIEPVSPP